MENIVQNVQRSAKDLYEFYDVNIPRWSSPLPIQLFPAHRALQGIHLGNRGLRGSMDLQDHGIHGIHGTSRSSLLVKHG